MFESDYIMRQIQMITQSVSKLFFHKDTNKIEMFEQDGSLSGAGLLYHRLKALINKGQINQAENLLFEEMDQNPAPEVFVVAVNFYRDLAELSDEALSSAAFSRDEIREGLSEIQQRFSRISTGTS